jgi:hypothetical protein
MTVGELIVALQQYSPDALVVIAEDSEGSNFSPLETLDLNTYLPETTWSGELVDDDEIENAVDAVVLWPVN